MTHRTRQELFVLGIIIGSLYLLAALYFYEHRREQRLNKEHDLNRQAVDVALARAYGQLGGFEENRETNSNRFIRPLEIRKALEVQNVDYKFGELTTWVRDRKVFITREAVEVKSGKFICFVLFGKGRVPYGVTSNGEFRYALDGEIKISDFVVVQ
jgi:hypothetical protein